MAVSVAAANYQEPDFEAILNKPPTSLQEHFSDWVVTKTGITFATKKEEAAFREGLRIGTALRGVHQASPENQERLAEARARAAEAAQEAAAAPAPAKAAPAKAVKAAPAKAVKATKTAPPAEAAPPAKRPPAKKTGGRRPAAQTAVQNDEEAPF